MVHIDCKESMRAMEMRAFALSARGQKNQIAALRFWWLEIWE